MATYNRDPYLIDTSSKAYRDNSTYFNQVQFKGLCNNQNVDSIDPNTFQEVENLYVDQDDTLSSRPKLQNHDNFGFDTIEKMWIWDDVHLIYGDDILKDNDNLNVDHNTLSLTEELKQIVRVENRIFIFLESKVYVYEKTDNNDYWEFIEVTANNLENYFYIPASKVYSNVLDTSAKEAENELTPAVKTAVVASDATYFGIQLPEGKEVTFKISGNLYKVIWRTSSYLTIAAPYIKRQFDKISLANNGNAVGQIGKNLYYTFDGIAWTQLPGLPTFNYAPDVIFSGISRNGLYAWFVPSFNSYANNGYYGLYIISLTSEEFDSTTGTWNKRFEDWTTLTSQVNSCHNYNTSLYTPNPSVDMIDYNRWVFIGATRRSNSGENYYYQYRIYSAHPYNNSNSYYHGMQIEEGIWQTNSSGTNVADRITDFKVYATDILNENYTTSQSYVINFYLDFLLLKFDNNNMGWSILSSHYGYATIESWTGNSNLLTESAYSSDGYSSDAAGSLITDSNSITSRCSEVGLRITESLTVGSGSARNYIYVVLVYRNGSKHLRFPNLYCNGTGYGFYVTLQPDNILEEKDCNFLVNSSNQVLTVTQLLNVEDKYFEEITSVQTVLPIQYKYSAYPTYRYYPGEGWKFGFEDCISILAFSEELKAFYVDDQVFTNPFNTVIEASYLNDIPEDFWTGLYPQHFVETDNTQYWSKNVTLYIEDRKWDENWKPLLYFPSTNTDIRSRNITNLLVVDRGIVALFNEYEIWYVTKITQDNVSGYAYYKSRVGVGCKEGADIDIMYDGATIAYASPRGIVGMNYQQLTQNTDQILTFLSDNISTTYYPWYDNGQIKIFKYRFWTIFYKVGSYHCLVLDIRTASWWVWNSKVSGGFKEIYMYQDKPLILDTNGQLKEWDESHEGIYKDMDSDVIEWMATSQPLGFGALNNYKRIASININNVQLTKDPFNYVLICRNYKDKRNVYSPKVVGFEQERITVGSYRTFVKRLNYIQSVKFQYTIANNSDLPIQSPISITAISTKYEIKGRIR